VIFVTLVLPIFYVQMTVHRNKFLLNKTNRCTIPNVFLVPQLYTFRAVSLPIIRSYLLYNGHWHILYRFNAVLLAGSGWNIL